MTKKKFIDLKEGDIIYWITMTDCELNESFGSCVKKLEVAGLVRSTNVYTISIRTKGGVFFTTEPTKTCYVSVTNVNDEVNLSFEIAATTKDEAIENARILLKDRMNILSLIKKRINEAETGLILADAALDVAENEVEEPTLEEFASMALG